MAGKLSHRLLAAAVVLSSLFTSFAHGYSGGTGEPSNPYQIASKADLLQLAGTTSDYGKSFILTEDIDLAGETFTTAVIAPDTDNVTVDFQGIAFSGIFDGNDHVVSGLAINNGGAGNDCLGLFGYVIEGAIVKKVGLGDCTITSGSGSSYVGAVVGWNRGNVEMCWSSGSISGGSQVGGVVGRNFPGNIRRSFSTANITATGSNVGGLSGTNNSASTISECYATGNVVAASYVGGLVGSAGGQVNNNYATGSVTGTSYVGGLLGSCSASLTKCYSAGYVSGSSNTGGLVGYSNGATSSGCFWDTQTSGRANSALGTGRTTVQMQDGSTFLSAGWDFVDETANGINDYWCMPANSYPILSLAVASPFFAPVGGVYNSDQSVTITCSTDGATIHYTTDGVDPTESDTVIASGASVPVNTSLTLKARAWKGTMTPSAVTTGIYVIQVATPVLSPGAGEYFSGQSVTITCPTEVATIHYTTNGVDPTESDPVIISGESVFVDHNLTLKARAWRSGWAPSPAVSGDYIVLTAGYAGGSGTPADPYQISSRDNLMYLAITPTDYDKSLIMTADVNLAGTTYTRALISPDADPCDGDMTFQGTAFTGVFDGDGHSITGLSINDGGAGNDYLGLFGQVGSGGLVKRVTVDNCSVIGSVGSRYVGGLVASASYATTEDCASSGTISGEAEAGGLIGECWHSTVSRCWSGAVVSASNEDAAGLVSSLGTGSTVSQCYATGNVAGGMGAGGLVAGNRGSISNSYATGSARSNGPAWSGGLVGYNAGTVTKSYSTGQASGGVGNGGLIGFGTGTTTDSFWDTQTSGNNTSFGGTGKTTLEMKTLATFTGAGWDFVGETANGTNDYWDILPGDYPTFTDPGSVLTPSFAPVAGTYNLEQDVIVTCETPEAIIHYTVNGTDPTESDAVIASGSSVLVDQSLTLKAKAWKSGMAASAVNSASYTLLVATPSFDPGGGTYNVEQNVVVTCATPGATIHYTMDGSSPTESDPTVASGGVVAVPVLPPTMLRIRAFKAGFDASGIADGVYAAEMVATPVFSPGSTARADSAPQEVTITCATPEATMHYTLSGIDPTESDPIATGGEPLSVPTVPRTTLKVKGFKAGYQSSVVASAVYRHVLAFHVGPLGSDSSDGESWATAKATLQAALDASLAGDEIWVAAGTYKPTSDYGLGIGERGKHFRMKNGVGIYGGFAGTETGREQRNWTTNETILSGDIDGTGTLSNGDAYHVFYHPGGLDGTAILDGFTISGGNANGYLPYESGGGMHNYGSSPAVSNCTFLNNAADSPDMRLGYGRGGAMANYNSSVTVTGCRFVNNHAKWSGGAVYNESSPGGMFVNCIFVGNTASGMLVERGTSGGIPYEFWYPCGDGGAVSGMGSNPGFTNCVFTANSAELTGPAFFYGAGTIVNSILWGNTGVGAQIAGAGPAVSYSDVQGGRTGTGNIDADPLFVGDDYGDLRLKVGSPCVDMGSNSDVTTATDLAGNPRIVNGDANSVPVVDMGAYERQCVTNPVGDVSYDCGVEFADYAMLADWWGESCSSANWWCWRADVDESGTVDMLDMAAVVEHWLEGVAAEGS